MFQCQLGFKPDNQFTGSIHLVVVFTRSIHLVVVFTGSIHLVDDNIVYHKLDCHNTIIM